MSEVCTSYLRSACTQESPGLCAGTHERQSNRVSEAGACTAFRSLLWNRSAVSSPRPSISRPGETLLTYWTLRIAQRIRPSELRRFDLLQASGLTEHHILLRRHVLQLSTPLSKPLPCRHAWNFEWVFRVDYHVVRSPIERHATPDPVRLYWTLRGASWT